MFNVIAIVSMKGETMSSPTPTAEEVPYLLCYPYTAISQSILTGNIHSW